MKKKNKNWKSKKINKNEMKKVKGGYRQPRDAYIKSNKEEPKKWFEK